MRSYEPGEFVSLLASNRLEETAELSLHGLVKPDESDSSILLFSTSSSCETWIPIPLALIASVRHIRNLNCKDHQHPFVKIDLVQPAKNDALAFLLVQLLNQARNKAARVALAGKGPLATRGDCEIFEFDDVPYLCCAPAGGGSGPWDCFIML